MEPLKDTITCDMVRKLETPCETLLCTLKDNDLMRFGKLRIRNMDTDEVLMEVSEEIQAYADEQARSIEDSGEEDLDYRILKYDFNKEFLDIQKVALYLEFKILGDKPINELIMIENHYFQGKLLRTFEFKFGFCMPNSTNSTEFFYEMPKLTQEEKEEMSASPYESKSDAFFFADGKLIVHNKAAYRYD